MPRFWYVADGKLLERRYLEADDLCQALLLLRDRGVVVSSAGPDTPPASARRRRAPWLNLLNAFYLQLAGLLDQGLPLPRALHMLARESRSIPLARSLRGLATSVEEGLSFSEALAAQPEAYDGVVVSVVEAAEAAGSLSEGLRSLVAHEEEVAQLAGQVAFPLAYPILMTVLLLFFGTIYAVFLLPRYFTLYSDLGLQGGDFPLVTRFLIMLLHLLPSPLVVVGLPLVVLLLLLRARRRTSRGRFELQLWRLRAPLFGPLALHSSLSRVLGTLSLLLRHGVELRRALRLAGNSSDNRVLGLALRRAEAAVERGDRLAEGLREMRLLPETVIFPVAAAEVSGDLPEVLRRLAVEQWRLTSNMARTWTMIAGPLVILFLGSMVALLGLGLFLPLGQIIGSLTSSQ